MQKDQTVNILKVDQLRPVPWRFRRLFKIMPELEEAWNDPLIEHALDTRPKWFWLRQSSGVLLFLGIAATLLLLATIRLGWIVVGLACLFSPVLIGVFFFCYRKLVRQTPLSRMPGLSVVLQSRQTWELEMWWELPIGGRRAAHLLSIEPLLKFDLIRSLIYLTIAGLCLFLTYLSHQFAPLNQQLLHLLWTSAILMVTWMLVHQSIQMGISIGSLQSSLENLHLLHEFRRNGVQTRPSTSDTARMEFGHRPTAPAMLLLYIVFVCLVMVTPWRLYLNTPGVWILVFGLVLVGWLLWGRKFAQNHSRARWESLRKEVEHLWDVVWDDAAS